MIRRNYVHDNANGLWCDFDNNLTIYEYNVCEDNDDAGILQEYGYNTIIRFNTTARNGRGMKIVSTNDVEVHDNVLVENSAIRCTERDHQLSGRFGLFRLRDLNAHHNTITLTAGSSGQNGIRDNLQGSPLAWDVAANNNYDFNDYFDDSAPASPFIWENNDSLTWAQWQTAGQDPNGSFT
jgi:nitrogen fixation protein FixH